MSTFLRLLAEKLCRGVLILMNPAMRELRGFVCDLSDLVRRNVRPSWTCSAQSVKIFICIYVYGFQTLNAWEDMMQLRELRSNFYRTTRLLSLRKKTEYINNIQNRSDFAAKGRAERELQSQARSKLVRCSEKRSSQSVKVYEYMKIT